MFKFHSRKKGGPNILSRNESKNLLFVQKNKVQQGKLQNKVPKTDPNAALMIAGRDHSL